MQYLLFIVLLYGLSGKYWQVLGIGFWPFAPSPFCPSPAPYYLVAPSYPVYAAYPPPSGFFDSLLQAIFAKKGKSYPPSFAYPPPPPPIYYPPPPPPPVYYPPPPEPQGPTIQDHIIKVHITDSGNDEEDNHHHHHHHHGHNMDYNNWD